MGLFISFLWNSCLVYGASTVWFPPSISPTVPPVAHSQVVVLLSAAPRSLFFHQGPQKGSLA